MFFMTYQDSHLCLIPKLGKDRLFSVKLSVRGGTDNRRASSI
jgi:hypothetical protein